MVQVKFKLVAGGRVPKRVNEYASGFDVYARVNRDDVGEPFDWTTIHPDENKVIPGGFCLEVPPGYEAQIRPRSGLAKQGIVAAFGTIDCDYRGEVGVNLFNHSCKHFSVKDGDRIAQIVFQEVVEVETEVVTELSETERGNKGFGSTGV